MLKELFYKWFGLEPLPCATCEVLKESLAIERQFNKVLFDRLLEKGSAEPLVKEEEKELTPIRPPFVPWRVRQQMLEAEDRKTAQLLAEKKKEMAQAKNAEQRDPSISMLEKELEIEGTDG